MKTRYNKKTLPIPKPIHIKLPLIQENVKTFQKLMVADANTNTLNEAPISDKIYSYNGKKYGRPHFRLLSENSKVKVPGQQGIRFSMVENNELYLNVVIEAFYPQEGVTPLSFRNVTLSCFFQDKGKEVKLPLSIKQILPVEEEINILKQIYANTKIAEENKDAIFEALTNPSEKSKLSISCEVWWEKPTSEIPQAKESKGSDLAERLRQRMAERRVGNVRVRDHRREGTTKNSIGQCTKFNRAALNPRGNNLFNLNRVFLSFRNLEDAQKALQVINFYKMTQRCVVDNNFSYFLSGDEAPSGTSRLRNEDCLPFNPDKITVSKIQNRWKIVEGSNWLLDFNTDATNARNAFKAIKQYNFDTICYVGRPNPGMTYFKSSKPRERTVVKAERGRIGKEQEQKIPSKPGKVEINSDIHLLFDKKDSSIFQGFFQKLESKEYLWERGDKRIENSDITHSYYYRLTNNPNTVFFLPQVYRIAVNPVTGEPRISINMRANENQSGGTEYRIHVSFPMQPYFHPKAKKDMIEDIRKSNDNIEYIEKIIFGGFQDASFQVNQRFKTGNTVFTEEFSENLENIDPTTGFTITANHSMESFDIFRNELLSGGIDIGRVTFKLEHETSDGPVVQESKPINVELNLNKLMNMDLFIDLDVSNINKNAPTGFILQNKTNIAVNVEGVELSLLSKLDNFIYAADLELTTDKVTWPLRLQAGESEAISINEEDIDDLSDENMVWTDLICEAYGVRADMDPEKIMASVIDHATRDPQMWILNISAPLFEFWEELKEGQKELYKVIMAMLVEIKTESGETFSARLNRSNPVQQMKMARSVGQLLKNSNHNTRKYNYRVTNITIPKSTPGEWKTNNSTSIDHLMIYPENLVAN